MTTSTETALVAVEAKSVTSFTDSIGINADIDEDASRADQNVTAEENALAYLGFKLVRGGVLSSNVAVYQQLNQDLGIKFDDLMSGNSTSVFNASIQTAEANHSMIAFVEGPNESDESYEVTNYEGLTGLSATAAEMQVLYTAAHSATPLDGIPVIQASFGIPATFATYGDHASSADYANSHIYYNFYPFGSDPMREGGGWMQSRLANAQTVTPGAPNIVTETGYETLAGTNLAVSDIDQAKYLLDDVFDLWNAGVAYSFIYNLVDQGPNSKYGSYASNNYGIYNADYTPKPAAIALHNLMILLADTGTGGVAPGTLTYSLSTVPSTVYTSLLEKSDGTFVLAIWNDIQLQNAAGVDTPVAPIAVTLTLSKAYESINIYDPLTGTSVEESFSNVQTVQIMVPDHPILIEISNTEPALTVAAANQPIINAPADVLGAADSIVQVGGLSISNVTVGNISVQVTADSGTITILNADNQAVAGSGTDSILLSGSEATVNAELATLAVTIPSSGGDSTISVQVTGASGTEKTSYIAVDTIARPAVSSSYGPLFSTPASMTVSTGSSVTIPDVVLTDDYYAVHSGTISVTVSAALGEIRMKSNGVELNAAQSIQVSGSYAQIAADLATLTYIAGSSAATDTLSFSAKDAAGLTTSAATEVNVGAAMTIDGITTMTLIQGDSGTVSVQIDDPQGASSADQLTVTISDKTGTLSMRDGNGNMAYGSGTHSITLSGSPGDVNGELGTLMETSSTSSVTDTITVTARNADGSTVSGTVNVAVIPLVTVAAPNSLTAEFGVVSRVSPVSITDNYAAAHGLIVTAVVKDKYGILSIINSAGDTIRGSSAYPITLTGSLAVVNAELATLTYTGQGSANTDTISVTASDTAGGTSSHNVTLSTAALGTLPAYFWVSDTAGDAFSRQPFINSGSMMLSTAATGLSGEVSEQAVGGVVTLTNKSWSNINSATLVDNTASATYVVDNFRSVAATLAAGPATGTNYQSMVIEGAQNGSATLGTGNQAVFIHAGLGGATTSSNNAFTVNDGRGTDELSVYGYAGYLPTTDLATITHASVYAGSGTDTMTFINAVSNIYASSGNVTVHGSNYGTNFHAGTGTADIWGGGGTNYFTYNAGDGLMTIEDFSVKDSLILASSLKAGITGKTVSGGVELLFSNSPHSEILVKGATSALMSHISWQS